MLMVGGWFYSVSCYVVSLVAHCFAFWFLLICVWLGYSLCGCFVVGCVTGCFAGLFEFCLGLVTV